MSLQYLGISHFPVLHRQFSSPTSRSFVESSPSEDVTQDNKDVLLERLNDLVLRLSKDNSLENSSITAIHSHVDKIEMLIRGKEGHEKSGQVQKEIHGSTSQPREEDIFWGPRTPTQSMRMHIPEISEYTRRPAKKEPQMTPAKAIELAGVAEELATRLSATVAELQTRKEESDHIHDLLITRAEKAAERILLLEYRIAEMEDDFEANQSELKFLKIQLQAVEAQCSQYIPRNHDPELTQSIKNWKVDWEDIDRRTRARRKKTHVSSTHVNDTQTTVDSSLIPGQ